MTSREMELEYKIRELKTRIGYCADIIEEISNNLLQEQMKGNLEVKMARDKLRDLTGFMINTK